MSSDNYWTIRKVPGGYMAYHGFMSSLEDGHIATRPYQKEPFAMWEDAYDAAESSYSEYGVIENG